jgi:gliding motility-associated-like protein
MKAGHCILLVISILISNCQVEDKPWLAGCCGTTAVDEYFGNARIFMPNIFTPNNDQLNDKFLVHGDSITRVIRFEIRNKHKQLVFSVDNVDANDYDHGWDGTFRGVVDKGVYYFEVEAEALDGTLGRFEGRVCNFPCGVIGANEIFPYKQCVFPHYWRCWEFHDGCQYPDFIECEE